MNTVASAVKYKPTQVYVIDDMSEQQLLNEVYQFYCSRLANERDVVDYVYERGFSDDTIEAFQIGYTNRMLHQLLKDSPSLQQERGRLKRIGLINPSTGHELLNGCIIIPIKNNGRIMGGYGRRARPTIRAESKVRPYHLVDESVLFNEDCLLDKPKVVLLCKSPLEAMSLTQMGFESALGFVGNHDLLTGHVDKLRQAGVKTVKVLFNLNDHYQLKLANIADSLSSVGMQCQVVNLADFVDVNHLLARDNNSKNVVHRVIKLAEKVTGNDIQ